MTNSKPGLVQVCYELTPDNLDREVNGLLKAMQFFGQKHGTMVTLDATDHIAHGQFRIEVVPAHEYLLR